MEHSKVFKISLWYGGVKELDNLVAEETIDLVEPETTGDDVKDLAVAAKYASEVERMLNHAACRTARKHLINWKGIFPSALVRDSNNKYVGEASCPSWARKLSSSNPMRRSAQLAVLEAQLHA